MWTVGRHCSTNPGTGYAIPPSSPHGTPMGPAAMPILATGLSWPSLAMPALPCLGFWCRSVLPWSACEPCRGTGPLYYTRAIQRSRDQVLVRLWVVAFPRLSTFPPSSFIKTLDFPSSSFSSFFITSQRTINQHHQGLRLSYPSASCIAAQTTSDPSSFEPYQHSPTILSSSSLRLPTSPSSQPSSCPVRQTATP